MTAPPSALSPEQEKRTAKALHGLADGSLTVQRTSDTSWLVANGDGEQYNVVKAESGWACTCPDWQHHCRNTEIRCKHIEATRLAAPTMSATPPGDSLSMNHTLEQITAALAAPFPASVINWKPQAVSKDKTKALAVAYIDARDVMARLDEVVGPFNWQVKHEQAGDQTVTGLGIKHPLTGEWVWKYDVGFVGGSESKDDDEQVKAIKGTASDGLKRAAVAWGIGRYLYSLPKTWVEFDADKRQLKTTPVLPLWAIPEADRQPRNKTQASRQKTAAPANGGQPGGNEATLNAALQTIIPEGKVAGKKLGEVDQPTLSAIAGESYKPTTPQGQACKQAAALILASLPAPAF
jgi:hypothetical protein